MVPEKNMFGGPEEGLSEPTKSLQEALKGTTWQVEGGRFALVGFPQGPRVEDLALLGRAPAQIIREEEGTTLLIAADALEGVLERHPEARVERDLAWVRFSMAMDWELVGFLAHVTGALAAAGVPLGCVCSFDRDHLFIAESHLEVATRVLDGLFPASAGRR
ncbi:MAG: ACT domain-containing protein [Planctomycetes bacterium]|nr:ACT domain-containing protein [Planctomycetota bacterium]